MSTVIAGSANASIEVEFLDKNGQPTIPNTVSYTIQGKEVGGVWVPVRANTPLVVNTTSTSISLDANDTALIGDGPLEKRRLCVYVDSAISSSVDFDVVAPSC
jgi:hypothetical protein